MSTGSNRRSGLLLMELILAILIFSLCAGVCLRIFAYAKTTADDSRTLTGAVFAATTAAERYKAARDTSDVWYDADWTPVDGNTYTGGGGAVAVPDGGRYLVRVTAEGGSADVCVLEGERVVYELTVKAVEAHE